MTDSVSTGEVQARFVDHYAKHAPAHKSAAQAVFQEWHAAEIRKARAAALREAAEAMSKSRGYDLIQDDDGVSYSIGKDNSSTVHDWLRDRADRIERGSDE